MYDDSIESVIGNQHITAAAENEYVQAISPRVLECFDNVALILGSNKIARRAADLEGREGCKLYVLLKDQIVLMGE